MTGTKGGFSGQRSDKLIHEHIHDPYRKRVKMKEPSFCPTCGAVYHKGRWIWGELPEGAHKVLCPACKRTSENIPAGIVSIKGKFPSDHGDEIINLARNEEGREKNEHPLNRIMTIDQKDGEIEITTTDIHLPRSIGHALQSAYKGELEFNYEEESYFIRVYWKR